MRLILCFLVFSSTALAQLPPRRTVTFVSDPPGAKVYLENSGGAGRFLGLSGRPLEIEIPALRDAAGLPIQYVAAQLTFRKAGHFPLTVRVGSEDWLQPSIPGQGSFRLTPESVWVAGQDWLAKTPPALGLVPLALIFSMVWYSRRLGRKNQRLEVLENLSTLEGDAWIGKFLGPYRLVSKLGRGGMGAVYKAEREGHSVALKLIPVEADDPLMAQRFRRECMVLSGLRHPNIVLVEDFGEMQGSLYLAMELVDGETLAKKIPPGGLQLDQALTWMKQILAALSHCHSQDIIHCDLKSDNIMVDRNGQIKLLDFGLARDVSLTRLTPTGRVLGTPAYVAPERIQADHLKPTAAVDQYALGVLFYLMLTGRLPFETKDMAALLRQHLDEIPPDLQSSRPDLPGNLCRTVSRMLNKSPQARWPSLDAISRSLAGDEPETGEEDLDTIELAQPFGL